MRAIIFCFVCGCPSLLLGAPQGIFTGDGPCPFADGCGGAEGGVPTTPPGGWIPGTNCCCDCDETESDPNQYCCSANPGLPPCPNGITTNTKNTSGCTRSDQPENKCCCCNNDQGSGAAPGSRDNTKDRDGDGCPDYKDPEPDNPDVKCESAGEIEPEEEGKFPRFGEPTPDGDECCDFTFNLAFDGLEDPGVAPFGFSTCISTLVPSDCRTIAEEMQAFLRTVILAYLAMSFCRRLRSEMMRV